MSRSLKEVRMSHAKPIPNVITSPKAGPNTAGTVPNTITSPAQTKKEPANVITSSKEG